MVKRWIKSLAKTTPEVDMIDVSQVVMSDCASLRQFAAQYSQAAYESMLEQQDDNFENYVASRL